MVGEFRRASHERVNAFPVDGRYLFKHYFEGDRVFARLREYYDAQGYRFEVPAGEFSDVQSFLADHGYGLIAVEAVPEFVVVVRKYTAHPDRIFQHSVVHGGRGDYNFFLLKDRAAVERAVDDGATRLVATDLPNPF